MKVKLYLLRQQSLDLPCHFLQSQQVHFHLKKVKIVISMGNYSSQGRGPHYEMSKVVSPLPINICVIEGYVACS